MVSAITIRPPYWSAQMPKIKRLSDPVKTGVATKIPNCVSFNPKSCLIWTPRMEKMVQIAKHTVNASVLKVRALV